MVLMEKDYINQIYNLTNLQLGNDWISKKDIQSSMSKHNIITYVEGNKILGYILFYCIPERSYFDENKLNITSPNNKEVAILKTIVSGTSGKGIGTKLMENFLKFISDTDIKNVYTPIWQSTKGANFKRLAEKFNFVNIATIPKYWYDDSLNKPNYCPVCNTPCVCTNLIYKLTLL
jgi:hypothetical protein